ncbi:hypothetical protein Tco_0871300 [Tanacetum coccineum]
MPGRPRKNRMKAQFKNNSQVSRLGRKMTCTNCQETGHNKSSCKKEPVPKPPKVPRPPALRIVYGTHASARVRGRGQGVVYVLLEVGVKVVKIWVKAVQLGCHKEEGEGEGVKEEEIVVREEQVGVKEAGEGVREAEDYETEQDEFNQEALRLTLEEEAMYKRMDEDILKEQMAEEEWDRKIDYYHPSNWTQEEESFDHEPYNRNVNTLDANVQTQESVAANMSNKGEIGFRLGDYEAEELGKQLAEPIVAVTPSAEPIASATHSTDKGKQVAEPQGKKKGSKRKAPASSEEVAGNQRIIFHKNRGRSERIFNQKMKKSGFGLNGEGSTPDKAFSLT